MELNGCSSVNRYATLSKSPATFSLHRTTFKQHVPHFQKHEDHCSSAICDPQLGGGCTTQPLSEMWTHSASLHRGFVLVGEDEDAASRPAIAFAEKDVRGLRPAKEAMHTGINVLLENNGLIADEIDQVIIARAAGAYLLVQPHHQLSRDRLDELGYKPK